MFVWGDGFEIGLAEVDAQHRRLVGILNRLARCHAGHVAEEDLRRTFDELADYTAYHFATEEALMAKAEVAQDHAAAHVRAHRDFVEKLLAARKEAGRAPRELTGRTLTLLTKWLIVHILGMDRRMGEEVRKAQEMASLPVTVAPPPSSERTIEVLLDAIDGLYRQLGKNSDELLESNRKLQQEVAECSAIRVRPRLFAGSGGR